MTTTTEHIDTDEQAKTQKRGRRTLIAILIISVLPVAAAYFMFFTGIGVPSNTVNKGALLSTAHSLEGLISAEDWSQLSEDKKWRYMIPVPEVCNEDCQKFLYTTRQVHIRLGEKSLRVERVALNYGANEGAAYLDSIQEDHPLLKRINVSAEAWQTWLTQNDDLMNFASTSFYLLVDQEGRAMMVYQDEHGNDLLKDIKRALKYSIDFQN